MHNLDVMVGTCRCITTPLLRNPTITPARNLPDGLGISDRFPNGSSIPPPFHLASSRLTSELSLRSQLLEQGDGSMNSLHASICPGSSGQATNELSEQSQELDPQRRIELAVEEMRKMQWSQKEIEAAADEPPFVDDQAHGPETSIIRRLHIPHTHDDL